MASSIESVAANALFGLSTWSPSYYTKDGSNNVTSLANIAPGAFQTTSTSNVSIQTDGAGKRFFVRNEANIGANGALSAAQRSALVAAGDIVVVISGQAIAAHSNTSTFGVSAGFTFNYGTADVFWPLLKETGSTGVSRYDLDFYLQYDRAGASIQTGPLKGMGSGSYNPATNVLAPGYSAGDNIVLTIFMRSTGLAIWRDKTPLTLRVAQYRNADGTAIDATAEANEIAGNFNMAHLNSLGAITGGNLSLGSNSIPMRCDHVAVYPASLGDDYFRALADYLKFSKPSY